MDSGQLTADNLEIIAHRGASRDAPENTLAAVRLAWEVGADAVEIDVMLSRDGEIVVIHDATTGRICGDDRAVRDLSLEELRLLDVGRWKGERWAGERVATLAEILATVPEGKRAFVEIKCGLDIVPLLERAIRDAPYLPERIVVIAFDRDVAAAVKHALPDVKVLLIVALRRDRRCGLWAPTAEELIAIARGAKLDGIDVGSCPGVDREFAATIRGAGLDLYVWTVNSAATARRLAAIGVQGIATDRPAWMRGQLAKPQVASHAVR
ncbi:MAG: glycerophosphodiester phosphodiesterase [Planctomycetales bacterium]